MKSTGPVQSLSYSLLDCFKIIRASFIFHFYSARLGEAITYYSRYFILRVYSFDQSRVYDDEYPSLTAFACLTDY